MWDEVMAWEGAMQQPWGPAADSPLKADDKLVQGMFVSHLARTSLGIGTEHLLTALTYSLDFRPTLFSMQTLLRTALVGGAQAVVAALAQRAGDKSRPRQSLVCRRVHLPAGLGQWPRGPHQRKRRQPIGTHNAAVESRSTHGRQDAT